MSRRPHSRLIVEDPSVFALEKHLEDFLVENWASTELGREYDIFEEDGEAAGQQDQIALGQFRIPVPHHCGGSSHSALQGDGRITVAVRSRKNDDASFHECRRASPFLEKVF